jgi:nickel transport protein
MSAARAGRGTAHAHGVGYRILAVRTVPLEFYYSTGETMAYLEAMVFSPADPKNSFQSGRTDEFGRYSFIPDIEGKWRVAVNDPEGHRAEASIEIGDDFFTDTGGGMAASAGSVPRGAEMMWRAVLGVSVIFNIAAFVKLKNSKISKTWKAGV